MTPREVDELDSAELRALWELIEDEHRAAQRAERRARKGRT